MSSSSSCDTTLTPSEARLLPLVNHCPDIQSLDDSSTSSAAVDGLPTALPYKQRICHWITELAKREEPPATVDPPRTPWEPITRSHDLDVPHIRERLDFMAHEDAVRDDMLRGWYGMLLHDTRPPPLSRKRGANGRPKSTAADWRVAFLAAANTLLQTAAYVGAHRVLELLTQTLLWAMSGGRLPNNAASDDAVRSRLSWILRRKNLEFLPLDEYPVLRQSVAAFAKRWDKTDAATLESWETTFRQCQTHPHPVTLSLLAIHCGLVSRQNRGGTVKGRSPFYAAFARDFDLLRYLHRCGYHGGGWSYEWAARHGDVEVLVWGGGDRVVYGDRTIQLAFIHCDVAVCRWLWRTQDRLTDGQLVHSAAERSRVTLMDWLVKQPGVTYSHTTLMANASRRGRGQLEVLKWLVARGHGLTRDGLDLCNRAAQNDQVEMFKWLVQQQRTVVKPSDIARWGVAAQWNGATKVVEWIQSGEWKALIDEADTSRDR
jgi:hypothetical protein